MTFSTFNIQFCLSVMVLHYGLLSFFIGQSVCFFLFTSRPLFNMITMVVTRDGCYD